MSITSILLILGLFGISGYYAGLRKSLIIRKNKKLHSTPIYHGALLAINSSLSSVHIHNSLANNRKKYLC
jgi:hypothetical protein